MKDELLVFVRIALYTISGFGLRGGWLPAEVASVLPNPEVVEAVTSLLLSVFALTWYHFSKARAALIRR